MKYRLIVAAVALAVGIGLGGSTVKGAPCVPADGKSKVSAADPAPNTPAEVEVKDGRLVLTYAGRIIFEGTIATEAASFERKVQSYRSGDKVEQIVYFFGAGRSPLKLAGTVRGSEESFSCESDRRDRRGAPGDPYILYLTEPSGFAFDKLDLEGAKLERTDRDGRVLRLTLSPTSDAVIAWSARFSKT